MMDGDVRDGLGCPSCRASPRASRQMTDKSPTTAQLPGPVDTSFHHEEGKKIRCLEEKREQDEGERGRRWGQNGSGDGTEAGTGRRRGWDGDRD